MTNIGASSAGKLSKPARAASRQANRCCGEMSCRRAAFDTTAPPQTIAPRSVLGFVVPPPSPPDTDADIDPASRL
jgi:hypothetical protein